MQRFKNKRVLIVLVSLAVLFIGAFLLYTNKDSGREAPFLEIDALNVGKADCFIITDAVHTILIDTGTQEAASDIQTRLKELNVSKIDLMILTHYDKDHIGSAPTLVNYFTIEDMIMPDYIPEKSERLEELKALPVTNASKLISKPYMLEIGDIKLDIRPANDPESIIQKKVEKGKEYDNNMSLVTMLTYEGKHFLFTGDIEKDRCKELLADDTFSLKADWIKMPEHGRYQKKLSELIDRVNPSYAVISTSKKEEPNEKTLNLLNERNIPYFITSEGLIQTTCQNGEITITIR